MIIQISWITWCGSESIRRSFVQKKDVHYFIQQNVSKETRIAVCSLDHGHGTIWGRCKSHRKKLVLLAPIMRGDKTKGILAPTVGCQKNQIIVCPAEGCWRKSSFRAPSSTSCPYIADLLWSPNWVWVLVVPSLQGLLARTAPKSLSRIDMDARGKELFEPDNTVCLCSLSASRHLYCFILMIPRTWLAAKFQNADVRSGRYDERVDLLWRTCTSENMVADLSPRSA